MSAPPFVLAYSDEAQKVLDDLQHPRHQAKWKKVRKTLRLLRDIGPNQPGLQSHKYHSMVGPNGEDVWESYVENKNPSAWRIFWTYGPAADELTIVSPVRIRREHKAAAYEQRS